MREEAKNKSSRICSRLAVLAVSVAGLLGVAPATASAQVFFSEYVEDPGVGSNKALEIYNGASTPVDLAAGGYAVRAYYNGSAFPSYTYSLTGTIAPGDVLVLVNSNADPALLAKGDVQINQDVVGFNGDDVLELISAAGPLDVIGQFGTAPATGWGTEPVTTRDHTLRRKPTISDGDPVGTDPFDPATEWDVAGGYEGLGIHTVDSDGDGVPNPSDNCDSLVNAGQGNLDGDLAGDACDSDDDNDGVNDQADACPAGATGAGGDLDGDGCKAAEDTDDDGDGAADTSDACGQLAGTSSGCPQSTRSLILKRATRHKLKGTLRAPQIPACRAGQKLSLMRKTRHGARKVRTVTTRGTGAFTAGRLRPGRYFVKAPGRLMPNVGFCAAARSKIVRLP